VLCWQEYIVTVNCSWKRQGVFLRMRVVNLCWPPLPKSIPVQLVISSAEITTAETSYAKSWNIDLCVMAAVSLQAM
jgi:hypothetical protein